MLAFYIATLSSRLSCPALEIPFPRILNHPEVDLEQANAELARAPMGAKPVTISVSEEMFIVPDSILSCVTSLFWDLHPTGATHFYNVPLPAFTLSLSDIS